MRRHHGIVRDQRNCGAFAVNVMENVQDCCRGRGVERAGGFVAKEDLWLVDQRPADAHPLKLPTGGFSDGSISQVGDADALHEFPPALHNRLARFLFGQEPRKHDVI